MTALPDYNIKAINDDQASANRIHSDETAQRFGFTGALVTGVSVFGYLSHPMVKAYGEEWFNGTVADVIFRKPAYDEDLLTVRTETHAADDGRLRQHSCTVSNSDDVALATLRSYKPQVMPEIDPRAFIPAADSQPAREEIHWDKVHIDKAVEAHLWQPSRADNQRFLDTMRDNLPLYHLDQAPYIHPHHLLSECNQALMRIYDLPAWIHTGTTMVMRQGIRVGDAIDVRAIPIDKWEKKGHEFIKLYIVMRRGDDVVFEAEHSAIFKIAA